MREKIDALETPYRNTAENEREIRSRGSVESMSSDHSYWRYLNLFSRHFWILGLTSLGGFLLGDYIFAISPSVYESFATIEVERVNRDAADVNEGDRLEIDRIAEISAVVEKLQMPSLFEKIAANQLFADRDEVMLRRMRLKFPWEKDAASKPSEGLAGVTTANLAGMMSSWVDVKLRRSTGLIDISVRHTDPVVAQDVVAMLLSEYAKTASQGMTRASSEALNYILAASAEVKEKMIVTEQVLQRYDRCLELSRQIRDAETRVVEMEKRYLPGWPDLIEAKELVRVLKLRFTSELKNRLEFSPKERDYWNEVGVALSGLRDEDLVDAQIGAVETRATVLRKDRETDDKIYDNLVTKVKEATVSSGYSQREFAVVQPSSLPSHPVEPKRVKLILSFFFGGIGLGVGLILVFGYLDSSIRTTPDLEEFSGLPVLGAVPDMGKKTEASDIMLKGLRPEATEAFRMLRANLSFLGDLEGRRVFLVTSALPGEGKSLVATNIAIAFAMNGERTLLIDADLRRPVQGARFHIEGRWAGLGDFLTGRIEAENIVQNTGIANLHLITAGDRVPNPAELLNSRNFPRLIETLSRHFDRIVVDTAPLVPVSDTLPLARNAQSVIMVCRMGKTPYHVIDRALRALDAVGCLPVGVVANRLQRTVGGYGASEYYYSYCSGGEYERPEAEPREVAHR